MRGWRKHRGRQTRWKLQQHQSQAKASHIFFLQKGNNYKVKKQRDVYYNYNQVSLILNIRRWRYSFEFKQDKISAPTKLAIDSSLIQLRMFLHCLLIIGKEGKSNKASLVRYETHAGGKVNGVTPKIKFWTTVFLFTQHLQLYGIVLESWNLFQF